MTSKATSKDYTPLALEHPKDFKGYDIFEIRWAKWFAANMESKTIKPDQPSGFHTARVRVAVDRVSWDFTASRAGAISLFHVVVISWRLYKLGSGIETTGYSDTLWNYKAAYQFAEMLFGTTTANRYGYVVPKYAELARATLAKHAGMNAAWPTTKQ